MADQQEKILNNPSLPLTLQSPGSDEDFEEHPTIINMQKALYETHINEQKRRIYRLETTNAELENYCITNKNNWSSTNLEAENEIVELNNNIAMEIKRINDYKKKVADVEALREKQKQNHLEKVKQIDEKYENTRIAMHSKIKEIISKVNSIEDFKSVEESLRAKYANGNARLQRREEELQQILHDIKFKAKLHKESLKKEIYKQLLEQSEKFQIDLKHIVPLPVQRLMRENIVLQNELAQLWHDCSGMEHKSIHDADRLNIHKENMLGSKKNMRRRLITIKLQGILLQKLGKLHSSVKNKLMKWGEPAKNFEQNYYQLMEKLKTSEFTEDDKRRRYLEVILHRERLRAQAADVSKAKLVGILNKHNNTLGKLKRIVNSALQIDKVTVIEDYKNMELEMLSAHLLSVIEKCDFKIPLTKSLETLRTVREVYTVGDLGFEPQYVDIGDQVNRDMERKYRLASSTSLQTNLKLLAELKISEEKIPKVEKPKEPKKIEVEEQTIESTSTETEEKSEETVSKVEGVSEDEFEYEEGDMDDIYDIYEDFNDYLQY